MMSHANSLLTQKKSMIKTRIHYSILALMAMVLNLNCFEPQETPNDPFIQLYALNIANSFLNNSCQNPSFTLRKNTNKALSLKPNEIIWFRFSYDDYLGRAPGVTDFYLKITKEIGTELELYTNNRCGQSVDSTYKREPITVSGTEVTYRLFPSDFENSLGGGSSENGYYVKIISGNPEIILNQE